MRIRSKCTRISSVFLLVVALAVMIPGESPAERPVPKPLSTSCDNTHLLYPTPMGVSGGNVNDVSSLYCCSGTLGCLVTDGNKQYILSNNHVLARTNLAKVGEDIVQPGLVDTYCGTGTDDVVANLTYFKPINFSKRSVNYVDAAIAQVVAGAVDTNGTINCIGLVSSTPVAAQVGTAVQKSGRTSGWTTNGVVSSVGAKVKVSYNKTCGMGTQTATFNNQIFISGSGFSAGGDSGSLIITNDSGRNPVGLLFAGSSTVTVANPIQTVLSAMGSNMTIVGTATTAAASSLEAQMAAGSMNDAELQHLQDIKARHEDAILDIPGVVGMGVGINKAKAEPVLEIYVEEDTPELRKQLPQNLDGVPVKVIKTGKIRAF